jgi:hypothetical protein
MYADAGTHTYHNASRYAEEGDATFERRILGDNPNHCECCIDEAAKGWQPWGILKEIGECECITNCNCSFEHSYATTKPGEEEPTEEPEEEEEEPIAAVVIPGRRGDEDKTLHIYRGGQWREAGKEQPVGVASGLGSGMRPAAGRRAAWVPPEAMGAGTELGKKETMPGRVWKQVRSWLGFSAEELDYLSVGEADFDQRLSDLRPALFDGDADKGKRIPLPITRDAFGYQEDNRGNKQCGQCIMWVPDKMRCTVHGEGEPVYHFSSCDYYIHGEPQSGRKAVKLLTPEESGLVHRQVRCENCWFLDRGGAEGSIHCDLFEKLNKIRPQLFDLEEAVEPGGCCNAQTPQTQEQTTDFAKHGKARVPVHIVKDTKSVETGIRSGKYDPTAPGTQAHTETRRRVEKWLVDKAAEHGSKPKLDGPDFDVAISEFLRGHKALGDLFTQYVSFADDGEGQWITIGGGKDEKGERSGGTHVFIKEGRITKGAPGLVGKKIDALKEEAEDAKPRESKQREAEYQRAVWGKKARSEGIDPKQLHQLAADMLAHDAEAKGDMTKMLQEARQTSKTRDIGDVTGLAMRNARGDLDPSKLKGFDLLARSMRNSYPHILGSDEEQAADKLFDLLVKGNPPKMTEHEAYEQAFNHLAEHGKREPEKWTTKRREELEEAPFSPDFIEVPDIVQPDHYSCGAAAAMSVGKCFGVGPDKLSEWKKLLGTNVEESTRPTAIIEVLISFGLSVQARDNMALEDLASCWLNGMPVICPVQDYGPYVPGKAKFAYGHYLTVIGVDHGYVFCQDSSQDNVTRGSGTASAPGRIMIEAAKFLELWHDKDIDGNKYVRFGIAVGKQMASMAYSPEQPRDEKGQWTEIGSTGPASSKTLEKQEPHPAKGVFNRTAVLANIGYVMNTGKANRDTEQAVYKLMETNDPSDLIHKIRIANEEMLSKILDTIHEKQPDILPAGWEHSAGRQ